MKFNEKLISIEIFFQFAGGHSTFFAMLNSFVHIVMYFYYMIAAMGPKYQKYIWWKKHLTTFQMVQFVAIFAHQFQLLFRECNYPKYFMVWIGFHGAMFLFLFSDFYKVKYTSVKDKAKAAIANGAYGNGNGNGNSNGNGNVSIFCFRFFGFRLFHTKNLTSSHHVSILSNLCTIPIHMLLIFKCATQNMTWRIIVKTHIFR